MAKIENGLLQIIKPGLMQRYEGRLTYIGESRRYDSLGWDVTVMFHIPESECTDPLEVYRRVNKVIHVIAEGDDEG